MESYINRNIGRWPVFCECLCVCQSHMSPQSRIECEEAAVDAGAEVGALRQGSVGTVHTWIFPPTLVCVCVCAIVLNRKAERYTREKLYWLLL